MEKNKIDMFLFCLRNFIDDLIFMSQSCFSILSGLLHPIEGLLSASSVVLVTQNEVLMKRSCFSCHSCIQSLLSHLPQKNIQLT